MAEGAKGRKIGRGKRQPSRANYKAQNRKEKNARIKKQAHIDFHAQKKDEAIKHGESRAKRRQVWLQKTILINGKRNMSFADFEKTS